MTHEGSTAVIGPVALIDGRAAYALSLVLRGSLRNGLSLRQLLAESRRMSPADQAAALAAAAALEDAGETWRLERKQSGETATRGNRVVAKEVAMTTQQAARILQLSDRRVRQLAAAGDIAGVRIGRGYVLDRAAVAAFRDARSAA